jgi:hypothetical protein
VRGTLHAPNSRRDPLTRNSSVARISTSPRKRGEVDRAANPIQFSKNKERVRSHSRGEERPSFSSELPSSNQRAQGWPGAGWHPWSACSKKARGRTTGSAEIVRPSLRNGFNGLLRALPGDRALLPPSPARCGRIFADLAPASGRQDHTAWHPQISPLFSQRFFAFLANCPRDLDKPRCGFVPRPASPSPRPPPSCGCRHRHTAAPRANPCGPK